MEESLRLDPLVGHWSEWRLSHRVLRRNIDAKKVLLSAGNEHSPSVPLMSPDSPLILTDNCPLTDPSCREEALTRRNGKGDRRSSRVNLRVPLRIYEPDTNKRFSIGEAYSAKVSLWGGLLSVSLDSPISCGQKLLLINENTGESKKAHVVYLGSPHSNRRLVGVEFLEPSPSFWAVTFPPVAPHRISTGSVEVARRAYAS